MTETSRRTPRLVASVAVLAAVMAVTACAGPRGPAEGIGFREARFNEMNAIRDWKSCRDQALDLDRQAREEGSSARYIASAQLLEKCESAVGPDSAKVSADERMRAYALASQNYLKGGDVPKARETLENLQSHFPGADLYYPNGASFIETMELLTGMRDRTSNGELNMSNVDDGLKSELRRAQYWKRN